MFKPDPVEALARTLVAALLPALEAAMLSGMLYRDAVDRAIASAEPVWRDVHGVDVARRAVLILDQIGPAAILTPYGRAIFLEDGPLVEIPKSGWPRANDNAAPPREGIGTRFYRAWVGFWFPPPASRA